ncbi:MAG: helix-turn-helix domain-containing protein [Actinomycetota bacterium]
MEASTFEPLLTIEGAAQITGLSSATLYAWVEAVPPRIPHVRLGRAIRFDPVELRAWVDENRRGVAS